MRRAIWVTLGMALSAACGGGDDNGGGKYPSVRASRVDESKQLGSLTATEQATLCEDVASWNSTFVHDQVYIHGRCLYNAITTASLTASTQQQTLDQMRANCTTQNNMCLGQTPMGPLPQGCAYPVTCTATVGDEKTCVVGGYQAQLDFYATLPSCDSIQLDTVAHIDLSLLSKPIPACVKIAACGPPM